jgi:hypothetical protein
MIRSIIAAVVFVLIAVHVAVGQEDSATQIKALQRERGETLTRLVDIYTLQYEKGAVSGDVFAGAETALVDAQLAVADNPDAVATILRAALERELDDCKVASQQARAASLDRYRQTDSILWSSVFSQTTIRLARALKDDSATVITWKQESRIQNLTQLVENYKERYKTGTAPLESLVKAQVALLDARLDAAGKHERIALLEEHARSEAELLKVAERKRNASACSARLLLLDTRIRILRELGAKDDMAVQIKAAQKERVEVLTELVKIDTELWETDWTGLATLTQAKADLANAQVDAADTSEAKILVLTEAAKEQAGFVQRTEARARVGFKDTKADVDRERLRLLDFNIRLLRERGLQKTRVNKHTLVPQHPRSQPIVASREVTLMAEGIAKFANPQKTLLAMVAKKRGGGG